MLVSAGSAATFVRTGQIRGRVFGADPRQPEKVSSVWHVACMDPDDPTGGAHVEQLRRRFSTFVLPREGERPGDLPRLETGLERVSALAELASANADSDRHARDHSGTRDLWQRAIGEDVEARTLRPSIWVMSDAPLPAGVRIRRVPWFVPSVPSGSLAGAGLASGVSGVLRGLGHVAGWSLGAAGVALMAWGGTACVRDTLLLRERIRTLGSDGLADEAEAQPILDASQEAEQIS